MKHIGKRTLVLALCLVLCAALLPEASCAAEYQAVYLTDFAGKTFLEVRELIQEKLPDWYAYGVETGESGLSLYCSSPSGGNLIFWCFFYSVELYNLYWERGEDGSVFDSEVVDMIRAYNAPISVDPSLRADMEMSELVSVCEERGYDYQTSVNQYSSQDELTILDYQGEAMNFSYDCSGDVPRVNGEVFRRLPETSNDSPMTPSMADLIGMTYSDAKSYLKDFYSGWHFVYVNDYAWADSDEITFIYGTSKQPYCDLNSISFSLYPDRAAKEAYLVSGDETLLYDCPIASIGAGIYSWFGAIGKSPILVPDLRTGMTFYEVVSACEKSGFSYEVRDPEDGSVCLDLMDELGRFATFQWNDDRSSASVTRKPQALQPPELILPKDLYVVRTAPGSETNEARIYVKCPSYLPNMTVYAAEYAPNGKLIDITSLTLTSGANGSLKTEYSDSSRLRVFAADTQTGAPLCDCVTVQRPE